MKGKKVWKVELFEEFANKCEYFYHDERSICGYNCKHPNICEVEEKTNIGKCFTFSCPLVPTAELEDFSPKKNIINEFSIDDFSEDTFVLVPVND